MGKEERLAICVSGTQGIDDIWATPQSSFRQHLSAYPSITPEIPFQYIQPRDRFTWCGQVDGVFGANDCWRAAASSLRDYIELTIHKLNISEDTPVDLYMHSHGGNVVLEGIKNFQYSSIYLGHLFFFSTPIRRDMKDVRAVMMKRVNGEVFYIHGGARDRWESRGRISFSQLYRRPLASVLDFLAPGKMPEIPDGNNIIDPNRGHSDTLSPDFMLLRVWPRLIEILTDPKPEGVT